MLSYTTQDVRCRHAEPEDVCYICQLQAEVQELKDKIAAYEKMDFVPLTASEP
jgi:hypothetical protein